MNKKINYVGNLLIGHDGELYIQTDDKIEHDLGEEISNKFDFKFLGDKKRVKLIIEEIK